MNDPVKRGTCFPPLTINVLCALASWAVNGTESYPFSLLQAVLDNRSFDVHAHREFLKDSYGHSYNAYQRHNSEAAEKVRSMFEERLKREQHGP